MWEDTNYAQGNQDGICEATSITSSREGIVNNDNNKNRVEFNNTGHNFLTHYCKSDFSVQIQRGIVARLLPEEEEAPTYEDTCQTKFSFSEKNCEMKHSWS